MFGTPSGSWIAPRGLSAGTLLVSIDFARANDLADGDKVGVGGVDLAAVVGDVEGEHAHQPVAWTDLVTWQQIVDQPGKASVVMARGDGSSDPLPGTVVTTLGESFSAIAGFIQEQGSLQLMQGFLMFVSALVVGAFFTVWIIQRRRDIAVLKAMGASTLYLLGDAIGQAAFVLAVASGRRWGTRLCRRTGHDRFRPVPVHRRNHRRPADPDAALGLVGAGLAIRSIAKVDPLTALGASR